MSNYHILTMDKKQKTINVVFHIPIPATGTNSANISWRDAIVKEAGGASNIVSTLPDISTQEDSDLKAGALFEKIENVRFSSISLTPAQRKAEIEAAFNAAKAELVAEKQITLAWMGYAGDVA